MAMLGWWLSMWAPVKGSDIINALCQNVPEERAIAQQELWNDTLSWQPAWWLNLTKYTAGVLLWKWGWAPHCRPRCKKKRFYFQTQGNTCFKKVGTFYQVEITFNQFISLHKTFILFPRYFPSQLLFKLLLFPAFSVLLLEPSCFVSCWAFSTGWFPHRSERHLNKHQQKMSEGDSE